jgi:hypothetical protein
VGFFNLSNPSSLITALGSTQPLTEMSTRNLPWCKGRPACKADNLTAICEPIFYKMWEPRRLTTPWASTACYRDNFTFYTLYSSPNIIRRIKSRRMRWAGHVTRMGAKRNGRRILVGKPEGKRSLGRPRCRWVGVTHYKVNI